MEPLADLQREFFDGLYTYRIAVAVGSILVAVVVLVIAWQRGWFAAAKRNPGRSSALLAVVLAVGLPLTWYLASPIWIRTELIEPESAADAVAVMSPAPSSTVLAVPPASAEPQPTPFAARTISRGKFRGTDDFHFGEGTARIVETAPGTYTLRLTNFSVRNGPDLYVYLSPDAEAYDEGALELGKLKATDGAFGYDLPPGTDPSDFASAIVWCKQFSHLFAVAPLTSE